MSTSRGLTRVLVRATVALGLSLALGACGSASRVVDKAKGSNSQGLGLEQRHPNGTVLTVNAVDFGSTRTTVSVEVVNGFTDDIKLNSRGSIYLRDSGGRKYKLIPPEQNASIEVPPGTAIKARLVFLGGLEPRPTSLRLLVNAFESEDTVDLKDRGRTSTTPTFQFDDLPVR